MKKILFILASFDVGGIEASVRDLCNELSKLNYGISILILSNNKLSLLAELSNNIKVYSLNISNSNKGFVNIVRTCVQIPEIIRVLKKISPDIIHTHIFQYHILPVLLAMRLYKKNNIHFHTIHTTGLYYTLKSMSDKIKLGIELLCYRYFKTKIICVSKETQLLILNKDNKLKNNIIYINNGVNTCIFNPNLYPYTKTNRYSIVYVARLVKGKNHITLLQAFAILAKKYTNLYLEFVGDGELREKLENFCKENDITDKVIFHGSIKHVANILSGCKIGVFPSEYEGSPLALLEMMAMKLPVVCSRIPSIQAILDKDYPLFFDVFDYVTLSKHIEALYLDKNLYNKYSALSYMYAETYSLNRSIHRYTEVYESINRVDR